MHLPRTYSLCPIALPECDHPLYPLVIDYQRLCDRARKAERICEELAPTPMGMMEDHPADRLTGYERDLYLREDHRCADLAGIAKNLHIAISAVVDNLGGW